MKNRNFVPIMPTWVNNNSVEKFWQRALFIFLEPQKIVSYFLTLNVVVPLFDIPLESILMIFAFSGILALSNTCYIAFVEKEERRKSGNKQWLFWLGIMTIGIFVCDFTGVYIHAMVDFHKDDPTTDLTFWKWISVIFPLGGSFTLSITHSITKRIDSSKVSPRQWMLLLIALVVVIFYAMWSDYQNNPHDLLKTLVGYLVT